MPGGKGASLYTVAPELQVQSDWSRHELKADLRGSYTGYSPERRRRSAGPTSTARSTAASTSPATPASISKAALLVSTDNPGSPNLQAGLAKLPIFTTFGGSAGIGQRFNRLELSVKGDVDRTVYQNRRSPTAPPPATTTATTTNMAARCAAATS